MSEDTRHGFFRLTNAERGAWREMAVTKLALDWLRHEIGFAKDAICEFTRQRKTDEAFIGAGKQEALETMLATFTKVPNEDVDTEETEPPDPAALPEGE